MYFRLRLLITIVALSIMIAHLLWPQLSIDAIALGLLVLALVPWLAPLVKSIELPGIGKIELQDIKSKIEEAKGAAESATQKADYAVAQVAPNDKPHLPDPKVLLRQLIERYNYIRTTRKAGAERTAEMTELFSDMVSAAERLSGYDVTEALLDKDDTGHRLSGYAYLLAHPREGDVKSLVHSILKCEYTPFGQYWGIQALGRVIRDGNPEEIDHKITQDLVDFLHKLELGTDRHYELNKLLQELQIRWSRY